MKKDEYEKALIDHILDVGLEKCWEMYGEGHKSQNLYYRFDLKNGEIRYFTNVSKEGLRRLGIIK